MTAVATSGTAKVTLPKDNEILITRDFAAPRHLVYKAWTTPELVMRWWAGQQGTMTIAEIDLRVGGKWRYVLEAEHGEVAFHGTYQEIVPNQRIVTTEVYEGAGETAEDQAAINVITFTEDRGRTTLHLLVQCPSKEVRDLILESGMEVGMQEQMTALEEIAISLA